MSASKSDDEKSVSRDYEKLNEKVQLILTHTTELQGALTRQFSKSRQMLHEIDDQVKVNHQLSVTINEKQQKVISLESENSRLSTLLEETQKQAKRFQFLGREVSQKLEEKQETLLETQEKLEEKTADCNRKSREYLKETEELKVALAHARAELDGRNEAQISRIQDQVRAETTAQIQKLRQQLVEAQRLSSELQAEKNKSDVIRLTDAQKIQDLEEELEATVERFEEMKNQAQTKLSELRSQLQQLRLNSEALSLENQRRIKTLELELVDARESSCSFEAAVRQKQTEIDRLRQLNQTLNQRILSPDERSVSVAQSATHSADQIYSAPGPSQDQ